VNTLQSSCPIPVGMINSNGFGDIKLNILVTNDDGVYADGLWVLTKELAKIGNVTVVAPDRDQSGVGTSVTFRHPLRLNKVKFSVRGVRAFSVDGTPGDSVILALRYAIKSKVDVIVSGINEGPNLGNDFFISGTVGGALQGYFYDIPAIAISVAAFENVYFDEAAKLAAKLAQAFHDGKLPSKLLLNVNLPNLPLEQIQGVEVTKLGERRYSDGIETGHDGKRHYYWIVRGVAEWEIEQGSDIWALEQNKISITPYPADSDVSIGETLKKLL
jgi:5'-nucleotidase